MRTKPLTLRYDGTPFDDRILSTLPEIDGKAGNDRITGGDDAQAIFGDIGTDVIRGMGGDDTLSGGEGFDTFIFERTLESNGVDTITDFDAGYARGRHLRGDILDLSAIDFSILPVQSSGRGAPVAKLTTANIDQYVWVRNGDLYIDTDGRGDGAEAEVWAHLEGLEFGDQVRIKAEHFQGLIDAQNVIDFEELEVGYFSEHAGFDWSLNEFGLVAAIPGPGPQLPLLALDLSDSAVPAYVALCDDGGSVIASTPLLRNVAAEAFDYYPATVVITRTDGSDFSFGGGEFASSELDGPMLLGFQGWRDGLLVETWSNLVASGVADVELQWQPIDELHVNVIGAVALFMDDLLLG